MQINVSSKGFSLSESEMDYILKRMEKISQLGARLKDDSSEIKVEVEKLDAKDVHAQMNCAITVKIPRDTLRAEASGDLVTEAIDLAKAKILPQIEKYKEKFSKK